MTDKIRKISTAHEYSFPPEFHDQTFYLWYKMGRPDAGVLLEAMKEWKVTVPTTQTLQAWKKFDSWENHADTLDGITDNAMDKEITQQRAELIRRQADIGKDLIDMGMDYLKEHGIDTSADAIRAIAKGAELQEKLLGWAVVFTELQNATDEDLAKKLQKLMTDDVVEGNVVDAAPEQPEDKTEPDA